MSRQSTMKERQNRVSLKDSRLMKAAISLAKGYVDAEQVGVNKVVATKTRPVRQASDLRGRHATTIAEQEQTLKNNYSDAFKAVADQADHASGDIRGIWRSARKARAGKGR